MMRARDAPMRALFCCAVQEVEQAHGQEDWRIRYLEARGWQELDVEVKWQNFKPFLGGCFWL